MQLEFVAAVISQLVEVRADAFRVAVAIFSDKNDFTVVFDYDDYEFRLVLLASSCCPLLMVSSQMFAALAWVSQWPLKRLYGTLCLVGWASPTTDIRPT
jgi:hypothetical protein